MNVKYPTGLRAHKIWSIAYFQPLPQPSNKGNHLFGILRIMPLPFYFIFYLYNTDYAI